MYLQHNFSLWNYYLVQVSVGRQQNYVVTYCPYIFVFLLILRFLILDTSPVIEKSYFYDISVKVDSVGRIDGLQSSLLLKEFGLFLVWSSQ